MSEQASTIGAQRDFTIVPNGVIGAEVSDRAFRVYVTLRAFVRPGNQTFPKISTVAERFGMSESYMKRGISELQDLGMIQVKKVTYAGGFRKVNSYFFPDISDQSGGVKFDPSETVIGVTLPGGSDLLPPKEEEKQEEENIQAPSKSTTAVDSSDLTRADVTSIVDCFSACLTANDVKHTVGKTWHNSARLLLDRDGNTVEQITWLIKWAMSHHFWKSNILSLPKFRAQFERLKLQARTEFEKTQAVAASTPSYWDQGPVVEYD